MQLLDKLDKLITPTSGKTIIGITGGGGKTTTLIALGKHYRAKGKKVLISTTTKLQSPRYFNFEVDHVFINEADFFNHESKNGESVLFVEKHIMNDKKVSSPRGEILSIITNNYDVIIFEADGARTLPCKIHSDRDPVITEDMTSIIAIVGLSSYGDFARNVCMGENSSDIVDKRYYQRLIDDERGLLKGVKNTHKAVILFNESDLVSPEVVESLYSLIAPCPIVVGSILNNIESHI